MDELGFNKIAAAILATALGFMGLKEISHSAMHVSAPDTPAYRIAVLDAPAAGEVVDLPFPQPDWIAAMDAQRGAKVFKKCTSCHNAEDGGANGTGPNLWNVVAQPSSQKAGFNYTSAMKNSGIVWDYETLDGFLKKPTKYLSGTAMNFVGLKKETDRAAVIEFLRQKSANPAPRPAPAAAEEASLETVTELAEDAIEDGTNAIVETIEDAAQTTKDVADDAAETLKDAAQSEDEE